MSVSDATPRDRNRSALREILSQEDTAVDAIDAVVAEFIKVEAIGDVRVPGSLAQDDRTAVLGSKLDRTGV